MISTDAEITGVEAERWAKCFYEFLGSGIPLFQAFALTKRQVEDVPMRINPQTARGLSSGPSIGMKTKTEPLPPGGSNARNLNTIMRSASMDEFMGEAEQERPFRRPLRDFP